MMIFLPPLPVKNQAMSDVFHPLLLLPMVGWPLLRSSRMRSISIFASPSFGPFDHNPPLLSQVSAIASAVLFSVTSASQPHVFYHYCFFFFIITNNSWYIYPFQSSWCIYLFLLFQSLLQLRGLLALSATLSRGRSFLILRRDKVNSAKQRACCHCHGTEAEAKYSTDTTQHYARNIEDGASPQLPQRILWSSWTPWGIVALLAGLYHQPDPEA